jgi:hypothetical protein
VNALNALTRQVLVLEIMSPQQIHAKLAIVCAEPPFQLKKGGT